MKFTTIIGSILATSSLVVGCAQAHSNRIAPRSPETGSGSIQFKATEVETPWSERHKADQIHNEYGSVRTIVDETNRAFVYTRAYIFTPRPDDNANQDAPSDRQIRVAVQSFFGQENIEAMVSTSESSLSLWVEKETYQAATKTLNKRVIALEDEGICTVAIRALDTGKQHRSVGCSNAVMLEIEPISSPNQPPAMVNASVNPGLTSLSSADPMGIKEFRDNVLSVIPNVRIDGSSVTVGIIDTGITLAHPAFLGDGGKSRIKRIIDVTKKNSIFLPTQTHFTARRPEESSQYYSEKDVLLIDTETLLTGDSFWPPDGRTRYKLEGFPIRIEEKEQDKILQCTACRLGFLREDSLNYGDFNGNGRTDDVVTVILLDAMASENLQILLAWTDGDFRKSNSITDWNHSKQAMKVGREEVGFLINRTGSKNTDVADMFQVSLVGIDPYDHGTHIAGIIAGKGLAADTNGFSLNGIAENCNLIVAKACVDNSQCDYLPALQSLVAEGVDIINMSIGSLVSYNDSYQPAAMETDRILAKGSSILVVSAGNSGPGPNTVGVPATAKSAVAVGAAYSNEMLFNQFRWTSGELGGEDEFFPFHFSARGPTLDGGLKPDLIAVGSALSAAHLDGAGKQGLVTQWGTSMAAPNVSGAYALLLDAARKYNAQNPNSTIRTDKTVIQQALLDSARLLRGSSNLAEQGRGMPFLPEAWRLLVAASKGENSASLQTQTVVHVPARIYGHDYSGMAWVGETPLTGKGIVHSRFDKRTIYEVLIERQLALTELRSKEEMASLETQLITSSDLYELQIAYLDSETDWMGVNVGQQLDSCSLQPTSAGTVRVFGRGVYRHEANGALAGDGASRIVICFDPNHLLKMKPGKHTALIKGYRVERARRVSSLASFAIPVFLDLPDDPTAQEIAEPIKVSGEVRSFGVNEYLFKIPKNALWLDIELSLQGDSCGGLTPALYAPPHNNVLPTNLELFSCWAYGNRTSRNSTYRQHVERPPSGAWSLLLIGSFVAPTSRYSIRLDYGMARGIPENLKLEEAGSFVFEVIANTSSRIPLTAGTILSLNGAQKTIHQQLEPHRHNFVRISPIEGIGEFDKLNVATRQSNGVDIDLTMLGCTSEAMDNCTILGQSAGPTDREEVGFLFDSNLQYYARIETPFADRDFEAEIIVTTLLKNPLQTPAKIEAVGNSYRLDYQLSNEQAALLLAPVLSADISLQLSGSLTIMGSDGIPVFNIPLK